MSIQAKYQAVLNLGEDLGAKDGAVTETNGVLTVVGTVHSAYEKNLLWDKIKEIGGDAPADIIADIKVETNDYYYDFQPCTFDEVDETPNSTMWTITGAVAALGLVFILCLLYKCCRGTKKNKKTTSQYAYDDDSDDDDDDDIKVT